MVLLDPTDPDYAVGFNPFAGRRDPSLVADQLGELFQRLVECLLGAAHRPAGPHGPADTGPP